jgi:hypothetical protein
MSGTTTSTAAPPPAAGGAAVDAALAGAAEAAAARAPGDAGADCSDGGALDRRPGVLDRLRGPSVSSISSAEPSLTLSPSLIRISRTTPAADDGISIEALSLSTVTSDCSAFTRSPGLTSSSMTSTSLKSPMSGTLTSSSAMFLSPAWLVGAARRRQPSVGARQAPRPSAQAYSGLILSAFSLVLGDRLGHLGRRHAALVGQRLQSRHDDVAAVDLEVLAQLGPEIAAARSRRCRGRDRSVPSA